MLWQHCPRRCHHILCFAGRDEWGTKQSCHKTSGILDQLIVSERGVNVLSNGNGFYFKKPIAQGGGVQRLTDNTLKIEDVPLKGKISKSDNARATVTFKIDPATVFNTSNVATWKLADTSVVHDVGVPVNIGSTTNTLQVNADGSWTYTSPDGELYSTRITIDVTYVAYEGVSETATYNLIDSLQTGVSATGSIDLAPQGAPNYLTKWTGFYTRRYIVDSVILTNAGSGYLIGEEVEILETRNIHIKRGLDQVKSCEL